MGFMLAFAVFALCAFNPEGALGDVDDLVPVPGAQSVEQKEPSSTNTEAAHFTARLGRHLLGRGTVKEKECESKVIEKQAKQRGSGKERGEKMMATKTAPRCSTQGSATEVRGVKDLELPLEPPNPETIEDCGASGKPVDWSYWQVPSKDPRPIEVDLDLTNTSSWIEFDNREYNLYYPKGLGYSRQIELDVVKANTNRNLMSVEKKTKLLVLTAYYHAIPTGRKSAVKGFLSLLTGEDSVDIDQTGSYANTLAVKGHNPKVTKADMLGSFGLRTMTDLFDKIYYTFIKLTICFQGKCSVKKNGSDMFCCALGGKAAQAKNEVHQTPALSGCNACIMCGSAGALQRAAHMLAETGRNKHAQTKQKRGPTSRN